MATILCLHVLGRNSQFQCITLVGTFDTLEPAILKDERCLHVLGRNSQFQCTTLVGTSDTLEPSHKWVYPSKFFASFLGELRK